MGDGGQTPPAAPLVPSVSRLAAESAAAPETLAPEEIREMREHLVFLREHKDALRLRLNAAEDLLVNGRREPSDRGVCRHLIGKVDRGVIEAAIGREPLKSNAAARARMLAGAIRLTADVGVLLAYLETLAPQRAHAEAAAAFAEVVRRIDFESLSATRLARLLQVLTETFRGQERVQVLFSLLDGDAFRGAFDAAAAALPPEVAAIFAPLRSVHRRLRGEDADGAAPADAQGLALGLEQVMAAPDQVLRGYAEPLRIRMLELALDPGVPAAVADRAAGVLLGSLARAGKTFTRLAMRRAAQLLARHVDDRARATLEEVRRAAPGHHAAERWLAALAARHMGRIAIMASPPERGRLEAAFWLDGQRSVWLRAAAAPNAARLAREAELQAALALPGVAPVVEHGVASGLPYVAVAAPGEPWRPPDDRAPALGRPTALALLAQAARILRALALADVALPDAEPERFCLEAARSPSLTLADLDGARATTRAEAERANADAMRTLAARLAPETTSAADLATLVRDLDRALLAERDA
ncbi:MAG: hypothetical protein IT294_09060 [Deltaproteobacteria bacterium]|nr:hypothetical protein [Deltaproteobacteria bacterium]